VVLALRSPRRDHGAFFHVFVGGWSGCFGGSGFDRGFLSGVGERNRCSVKWILHDLFRDQRYFNLLMNVGGKFCTL